MSQNSKKALNYKHPRNGWNRRREIIFSQNQPENLQLFVRWSQKD